MKITVIGSGYVGLVVGPCLADMGNDVINVDIDTEKIAKLNEGKIPIYEPGLNDIIQRNVREKRLSFTTDIDNAIQNSGVIFIAVGTPPGANHEADLSAVMDVAKKIGQNLNGYKVIVDKSTVPVGTAEKVNQTIKENSSSDQEFDVVSNPEFLREGEAIKDFTIPDRILIGCESERACKIMEEIYKGIARTDHPIMFTDIKSAELIKYASNAMLATRISFMNELSYLCEKVGADIKQVAKGMGLDNRIGPRFLQAGAGYGGSCFPKDIQALAQTLKQNNCKSRILDAVETVNDDQKKSLLPKIQKLLPDLSGKKVAIWGLAFKPKTDDMRDAPSLVIIEQLQKLGANIVAFDPEAEHVAKKILSNIKYAANPYEGLRDADLLVIITEWNIFRSLDKERMKSLMNTPNIVDGRNVYEPDEMRKAGFNYIGVGR